MKMLNEILNEIVNWEPKLLCDLKKHEEKKTFHILGVSVFGL